MEDHRPRGRSAGAIGCFLVAMLVLGVQPGVARAQSSTTVPPPTTAPPATTTTIADSTATTGGATSDPTATTTADGSTDGTTEAGPDATTSSTTDESTSTTIDPLIGEEPGETVPETEETVPPPDGAYGGQGEFTPSPVLWSSVREAERKLAEAEIRVATAFNGVRDARRQLKQVELHREALRGERKEALEALEAAERTLTRRSIAAFVGADAEAEALVGTLQAADHDRRRENWIRTTLLAVALDGDDVAIDNYRRIRSELDGTVVATVAATRRVEERMARARQAVDEAIADRDQAADEMVAFEAGSAIYIKGARFPLAWPYDIPLIDSFGFPRMPGTPDEHWHEGIDLFAPSGTPLVAAERGVILRISTGRLGGLTFWLRGESGADWYYAHLQSYAPGLAVGQVVEAGEVVGFVGNTGNAVGTPPHLHLQLHPGAGDPVNPYPLLKVLSDRELAAAEAASGVEPEAGAQPGG